MNCFQISFIIGDYAINVYSDYRLDLGETYELLGFNAS